MNAGSKRARADRLGRLRRGSADRRRRVVESSLGQPQEGQTGLGLTPVPARVGVRLGGRLELAEHAVDLCPPVRGLAGGDSVLCSGRTRLGPPGLLQCLRPRAAQLHELRAVGQAAAGEGHEIRLALAPVRERGRPLLCTTDFIRVLAREDHAAVRDPGHDRRELTGRSRQHRLVQQPQPLVDAPESDQDVAELVGREREEVRVAELLAGRHGLAGGRGGRLEVVTRLLLEDERKQQVAAFDAICSLLVEDTAGSAEPAARATYFTAAREIDADPERAAHGILRLPAVEVVAMGPLEQIEVLGLTAEHVRRRRQQLELVGWERIRQVSSGQQVVRRLPRLCRVGLSAPFALGHASHTAADYRCGQPSSSIRSAIDSTIRDGR